MRDANQILSKDKSLVEQLLFARYYALYLALLKITYR
jgi:hypothetical protein